MNPGSKAAAFSILQPKSGQDKAAIKKITDWVSTLLESFEAASSSLSSSASSVLRASYTIMVTQVQCYDPNCVPLETVVILVGDGDKYSQKIQKPIVEVVESDVESLSILEDVKQKFFARQVIAAFTDKLSRIKNQDYKLNYLRSVASAIYDAETSLLQTMEQEEKIVDEEQVNKSDEAAAATTTNTTTATPVDSNATNNNNIGIDNNDNSISDRSQKASMPTPIPTFVPMVLKSDVSPALSHSTISSTIVPMVTKSDISPLSSTLPVDIQISNTNISNANSSSSSNSNDNSNSTNNSTSSSSSSSSASDTDGSTDIAPNNANAPKSVSLGASSPIIKGTIPVMSAKPSTSRNFQALMMQEMASGSGRGGSVKKNHEKKSGCPCCDPDNVDSIIDKMMFFEA